MGRGEPQAEGEAVETSPLLSKGKRPIDTPWPPYSDVKDDAQGESSGGPDLDSLLAPASLSVPDVPDIPAHFPRSVYFIIGNEFCERFSYYGMRAILTLYLIHQLKLDEEVAVAVFHLYIFASYFSSFIGAQFGDSYWGKYSTIFRLSLLYVVGDWLVALSARAVGGSLLLGQSLVFVGLFLASLGCGGIKPCVSAFGGEQIKLNFPPGPARDLLVTSFFSFFYLTINVGSFFSMILTPIIRGEEDDPHYFRAFGLPALLMLIAIAIFWAGSPLYKHQQRGPNVLLRVASVVLSALLGRPVAVQQQQQQAQGGGALLASEALREAAALASVSEEEAASVSASMPGPSFSRLAQTPGEAREEVFSLQKLHARGKKRAALPAGRVAPMPSWLDRAKGWCEEGEVEDVKQLFRVLVLFLPTIFFWALYDQQGSSWTIQADRMAGALPFNMTLKSEQMQAINAVLIIVLIPLFDQFIYPLLTRSGVPVTPIGRMVWGMLFGVLAFVLAAGLEVWVNSSPAPCPPPLPAPVAACTTIHRLWQVPQYVVLTVGEILLSITALEFAFSQAPDSMKSLLTASWLACDALGNLFTAGVSLKLGKVLSTVGMYYFFAAACFLAALALWWLGREFTYLESCAHDHEVVEAEAVAVV